MKIIISAGGTGGHLYPALALAEYIKKKNPDTDFLFVGTVDRLEKDIVPNLGYAYKGLKVKGLTGNIFQKAKHAFMFVSSLSESKKILKEYKPDIVIGFGGYPSASIVLAASQLGIPTLIHEQNSIIGLTNKILIKKVDRIVCCYEKALEVFPTDKTILLGNPRASVVSEQKLLDIHDIYNIPKDKKTVVIVMGSLGSESINEMMTNVLDNMQADDYHVIYVTGKDHYEDMKKELKHVTSNIHLVDYINDMPSLISSCDLIVSRAGATTLAEITALGAASLLIPSPYVVANHQEYNAKELVDKNAAEWILEKDLAEDVFLHKIRHLLKDENKLKELKENARKLGKPNACEDIYQEVLKLLNK
jgi:UDP-N-acetylglucosamine--N-acetylmuramyl-(pentapeptide) pyrophosphoryl-undecaprenol N-acetylglucosamine transferase